MDKMVKRFVFKQKYTEEFKGINRKNSLFLFTFQISPSPAFTLAEILITVGIIGIVATIVLPRLVADVQAIAWGRSKENSLAIISEATKQMKSNDVLAGYNSNADFMNVFSKYIKIIKQCDSSHLEECFTPKFKTAKGDLITTSSVSTGTKLNSDNLSDGTISFMLKNGTTVLFSLKDSTKAPTECARIETWNNQANTTSCMSFLYDINGSAGPNIVGKDIGNLSVTSFDYAIKLSDGTKLGYAFMAPSMSAADCNSKKGALGIINCLYDNDKWAGAVAQCGGVGNMPTQAQLATLARDLYGCTTASGSSSPWVSDCTATLDHTKAGMVGFPFRPVNMFSLENGAHFANARQFDFNRSFRGDADRSTVSMMGICVVK